MKEILKNLTKIILKLIAYLMHPFIVKFFSFLITTLCTSYIVRQMKSYGKNPEILFPISSYGLNNISIGDNFHASSRLILETYTNHLSNTYKPEIIIGNNVRIGYDCHIGCINKIIIGNNVLIASKVFITDHFHGDTSIDSMQISPNLREVTSKGVVIIEDDVWIGEGVAIMPNITIGKNSIIGANSVVTKDVLENSIVGGNPARIIKMN